VRTSGDPACERLVSKDDDPREEQTSSGPRREHGCKERATIGRSLAIRCETQGRGPEPEIAEALHHPNDDGERRERSIHGRRDEAYDERQCEHPNTARRNERQRVERHASRDTANARGRVLRLGNAHAVHPSARARATSKKRLGSSTSTRWMPLLDRAAKL